MSGGEKLVGMHPCAGEPQLTLGLGDVMGKRQKGCWGTKSQKWQRTINQFKEKFPSPPESVRFIREQVALPHFLVRAAFRPHREERTRTPQGRSGTASQKLKWEGLFLCSGTGSCRAQTSIQCPEAGQLLLQPGDGSSRAQAAPRWKWAGGWGVGGRTGRVHSGSRVWGMMLCSVLDFEKNRLGLKEPDIASSIKGGTAIFK